MPRQMRIADEFTYALAGTYSERLLGQIKHLIGLLSENPELGSRNVRPSLLERYGDGVRKLPVSNFVIVYRISGEYIDVLALVYGPSIV